MCGVAGILESKGSSADRDALRTMIDLVQHRGPDESGIYAHGPVGLAHARLSIIDLATGQQPMHNADRSLTITFNGEIFNYIELRKSLESRGHRFATTSDTEVILHAYEDKGPDCVRDFNGQWSFAIWDEGKQELFISRDRLGVRPLFYRMHEGTFLFASEMKSILSYPGVPRTLDLKALDQILTFWFCLPPRTIFEGIQELPPGHSMKVSQGEVHLQRYWQPSYPTHFAPMNEEHCAQHLLELLVDATRLRLRADVPVGAYLSGGLDSSVTTALIKNFTTTPLKTFSVVFDVPEFDERTSQDEMVRHLDTRHQHIECSTSDIGRIFPDVVWHTEKPIIRTAPSPLYMLSQLVRENGYKVVLTGEGADEILGGYDIFKEAKVRRFWGQSPRSRLRPLLLAKLYPYMGNLQKQTPAYLQAFFHVSPADLSSPFFSHLPRWKLTAKSKLFYSAQTRAALNGYDPCEELLAQLPAEFSKWQPLCQAQYLETSFLLPGYILSSQGDRMAMSHGIEGRFPFLDHRVVDFAATIPPRLKMKGMNEKYILKKAIGDRVPDSIRRRPKQPYRAPDSASVLPTNGSEPPYVRELLSEKHLDQTGIFNSRSVTELVRKSRSGQAIGVKDNMAVVGILSTQLVNEQFITHFGRLGTHAHA